MKNMIKPNALNKGDHVAIVSLSSGILGEPDVMHQLKLGIKRLKEMGLIPVFMPNALKGVDFVAQNPLERASDLKLAFSDQNIKGIICAIGGDDTYKTMPYLMADESFKALVINNPKIFIGFSDSTNNHFMFNKLGLTTYYGLNFLSDLCELSDEMLPYTKESYAKFFKCDDTFEITSSPIWYRNRDSYGLDQLGVSLSKHQESYGYEVLYGQGRVLGKFFGGCLESIYDLYSSQRYSDQREIYDIYDLIPDPAFYKDKLLFVETSEEKLPPQKFKEILEYFIQMDVLTQIQALIVGKPYDEIYYHAYKKILIDIGNRLKLPIIYNVNFGHALPRAMIPYHVMGEIDFDMKTIKVIEKMFK